MSASTITTHHWIARDPASLEILRTVDKVKDTPSTLLIQGESGTGKDLLAGLIHYSSLRCDEPFLKIDCSSIPEELLESELFGYEKGAFTGAYARKLGKLEFAGKGTIVLDEITALGIETQAKLLRVIEDRNFGRLGGTELIPVDARLVVLSREPLGDLVRGGTFREDLFFRLNVIPIRLLPLRERTGDIIPLVEAFSALVPRKVWQAATQSGTSRPRRTHGLPVPGQCEGVAQFGRQTGDAGRGRCDNLQAAAGWSSPTEGGFKIEQRTANSGTTRTAIHR